MSVKVPGPVRLLIGFPALLRGQGFTVAPEQTVSFLQAVELLGPRTIEHVRKAAVATLAPHPEQRVHFEALFDMHFLGAAGEPGEDEWQPDDEMRVQDDIGTEEVLIGEAIHETGQAATGAEALAIRTLRAPDDAETLRRLGNALPDALPRRRGYRHKVARRGKGVDLARSLRAAMRNEGEVMSLKRLRRTTRPRPVLLLIDVSGSMKQHSDAHLALAHEIIHATPRAEVFTFGTRLTRLTRALRLKNRQQALAAASGLVADWDGGTRIGDALEAFLAVPRFAGYARGANVIVLSDGLERGDPSTMIRAVRRLAARAFRIDWFTPLAVDPDYRPETEALRAVLPLLASLGDASSTSRLCRAILAIGGTSSMTGLVDAHFHIWRQADLPWLLGPMQPRIFGPYEAIRRDYPIEEYLADCRAEGITEAVYVQANWAPAAALDEVRFVAESARRAAFPIAIVAYADMLAEDVRPQLDALAVEPSVRGVRMRLHWHENPLYRFAQMPDLARDPLLQRNVGRLADYGWSFDLQVFAGQMEGAAALATACPGVTFVLQHAGMLEDLTPAGIASWREGMTRLAACPNIVSKLSGLGTFLRRNDPAHVAFVAGETLTLFGAQRCLFGSNFPIEKLWTSYAALVGAHRAGIPATDHDQVFNKTARRVYRLGQ